MKLLTSPVFATMSHVTFVRGLRNDNLPALLLHNCPANLAMKDAHVVFRGTKGVEERGAFMCLAW